MGRAAFALGTPDCGAGVVDGSANGLLGAVDWPSGDSSLSWGWPNPAWFRELSEGNVPRRRPAGGTRTEPHLVGTLRTRPPALRSPLFLHGSAGTRSCVPHRRWKHDAVNFTSQNPSGAGAPRLSTAANRVRTRCGTIARALPYALGERAKALAETRQVGAGDR